MKFQARESVEGRREEVRGLVDFLEKYKEDQRFVLVAAGVPALTPL